MSRPAQSERAALCDAAVEFGPDAPTLCDPWSVADLLAHLIVRESRPDLAAGMFVPPLAGRLERAQAELAASDFGGLVERVRTGPPWWSPMHLGPVDELMNLGEFFVHTEDIRRANGLGPRALDAATTAGLDGVLRRMARLLYRSSPVGVHLVPDGGASLDGHAPTELGTVMVTGSPGELLLAAFGRQRVAEIEVTGPDAAVAAFTAARPGV